MNRRTATLGLLLLAGASHAWAEEPDPLALESTTSGVYWLLAFMTVFLGAAALVHRRFSLGGRVGGGPDLRMVATLSLGDKRAIVMIEAEAERLLVGITPQNIQLLTRVDRPEVDLVQDDELPPRTDDDRLAAGPPPDGEPVSSSVAGASTVSGRFGSLLRTALERGRR